MSLLDYELMMTNDGRYKRTMTDEELHARTEDQLGQCWVPVDDPRPLKEPILEFADEAQAYECLKEWQTRLFMDDWIVKLVLCGKGTDDDWGDVAYQMASQKAIITLYNDSPNDSEIKKCMEKTLVHELLHLAFYTCTYGEDVTVEESVFATWEHRRVDQIAKSLIMAKYNLTFDWFKNF